MQRVSPMGALAFSAISVNSRWISSSSRAVNNETATATTRHAMKPGTISYIALDSASV